MPRLIGAMLLAGALPAGTMAATAADLLGLPLESLMALEVSVASPFRESVMEAASSVAVLRPVDWERRTARSLYEALEQVPSVVNYPAIGTATATAIRGYATELSVRGVATLLDGVPLNNFSYATAAYDLPFMPLPLLGRIEMIRGPGSTLYGSDAFHGVVALSSAGRVAAPGAAGWSMGSQDDGQLYWRDGGRVGVWRGSAGVAASHHGDRDLPYRYTEPATGASASGVRDQHLHDVAGYLHGSAELGGGEWRFGFFGDNYRARGFPGVGTQFYQPLRSAMQTQSVSFGRDRDAIGQASHFWQAQLGHERPLSPALELELRAFQWQSDQEWVLDNRSNPLTLTTAAGTVLPCRTSPTQAGVSPLYCPHHVFQGTADRRQGVQLQLRQEERRWGTQWAVGGGRDWQRVEQAWVRRVGSDGSVYVRTTPPYQGLEREIDHLLFQARTDWQEGRWAVVYGARWDDYSDVGATTSPRLGLIFRPAADWTTKLLHGRAFRAPTAAERLGGGPGSLQLPNPGIQPEHITTTELVFQRQREAVETELVLFRSDWDDGIVLNPLAAGVNQYQNAGANRARGVELSQRWRWRNWQGEGNLAYVHSENRRSGQSYGAYPRSVFNLGLGRSLVAGWSGWLSGRALLDRDEADVIAGQMSRAAPNYVRIDLRLERAETGRRVWLDLRNLLDRRNIVPAMYNAEGGLPEERRSLRLGVELPL